jgi:hypothetical protein
LSCVGIEINVTPYTPKQSCSCKERYEWLRIASEVQEDTLPKRLCFWQSGYSQNHYNKQSKWEINRRIKAKYLMGWVRV